MIPQKLLLGFQKVEIYSPRVITRNHCIPMSTWQGHNNQFLIVHHSSRYCENTSLSICNQLASSKVTAFSSLDEWTSSYWWKLCRVQLFLRFRKEENPTLILSCQPCLCFHFAVLTCRIQPCHIWTAQLNQSAPFAQYPSMTIWHLCTTDLDGIYFCTSELNMCTYISGIHHIQLIVLLERTGKLLHPRYPSNMAAQTRPGQATNRHANVRGELTQGPIPRQKNHKQ